MNYGRYVVLWNFEYNSTKPSKFELYSQLYNTFIFRNKIMGPLPQVFVPFLETFTLIQTLILQCLVS